MQSLPLFEMHQYSRSRRKHCGIQWCVFTVLIGGSRYISGLQIRPDGGSTCGCAIEKPVVGIEGQVNPNPILTTERKMGLVA